MYNCAGDRHTNQQTLQYIVLVTPSNKEKIYSILYQQMQIQKVTMTTS